MSRGWRGRSDPMGCAGAFWLVASTPIAALLIVALGNMLGWWRL